MDVLEFQKKLEGICALAERNNKKLTTEQVREYFEASQLEKEQLLKILQYLKVKGISIEGLAEKKEDTAPEAEEEETYEPLTKEEEAYLQNYLEELRQTEKKEEELSELFQKLEEGDVLAQMELAQYYLPYAARMAAKMNSRDIFLADLIQEANVGLLTALEEEQPTHKDEKWLLGRIRFSIRQAVEEQTQQKFHDDYLVSKVEKLESAVKELTEDEEDGSLKFSIDELAVILDMDAEEIRDVLRLTGDDKD
ncbi:MAG: sigma factor [Eubacteriales bacterium]|nr:sigma factor [Eubacteriales bacterium]